MEGDPPPGNMTSEHQTTPEAVVLRFFEALADERWQAACDLTVEDFHLRASNVLGFNVSRGASGRSPRETAEHLNTLEGLPPDPDDHGPCSGLVQLVASRSEDLEATRIISIDGEVPGVDFALPTEVGGTVQVPVTGNVATLRLTVDGWRIASVYLPR